MRNPLFNAWQSLLHNPRHILFALYRRMPWIIQNDEYYLRVYYWLALGKKLDFENPQTFNEKLSWLKLYNRRPEYTEMVDKVAVKNYVASIIGKEYIIPTLAVWNSPNCIDWTILPDKFVIKTNHDGGGNGVVVCADINCFDKKKAELELKRSYNQNRYMIGREWPYKNIKHQIMAEEYLEDKEGNLVDYKFFCFDGKAECVMVCLNRQHGETQYYFFDAGWNLLRLNIRGKEAPKDFTIPKPDGMDKMFEIASKLSQNLPFARIDLYNVDARIYFGEITFFPADGVDANLLHETDILFGKMIHLPKKQYLS